jgi:ABC-type bacteriocin/lantibiotic exporter with double-glycine peptidase domain
MDEKTAAGQPTTTEPTEKSTPESPEVAATEHRWRIILPAFVVLLCVAILAVPLMILIPLFVNSLDVNAYTHNLTWLWIVMIVLEIGFASIIIFGLLKIFLTQAGNYQS